MLLFEPTARRTIFPPAPKTSSMCPAPATPPSPFLSMALCLRRHSAREAAELANCASGIAVGKLGTATVSQEELETAAAALP